MTWMNIKPGQVLSRPAQEGIPALHHVFDVDEINAIDAALAAERPLLIRGEPGIGKSQIARAAAYNLGRAYVQFVVDARTESSDLLWHFDAVSRLAKAQIWGALSGGGKPAKDDVLADLDVRNFVHPRQLWWAFNWPKAAKRAKDMGIVPPRQAEGCDPANGCVVLIDEIDKAETDVPNGLLEALGMGSFTPQGFQDPVMVAGKPPLVIITTNEERALPDAFLRRCLVLHKRLPSAEEGLKEHLVARAVAHFGGAADNLDVFGRAADMLIRDREQARNAHWLPLPGQAEYLDLVRAVLALEPKDGTRRRKALDRIERFALKKHPDSVG